MGKMELVIELRGLASSGWFEELTKSLAMTNLANVQLSELRPAPGTFGAILTPKVKARLSTAAELATVLSLIVSLYALIPGTQSCQVRFTSGSTRVEMVVPCQRSPSSEFATTVTNALAKFSGEPPT